MTKLQIKNLCLKRGEGRGEQRVLNGLSLEVGADEILGLIGPSGCGKTSLLYALAGVLPLESGELIWEGSDLAGIPVHKRNFGMLFQDHLLFPHKTVEENIAFGLKASLPKISSAGIRDYRKVKSEIKKRVAELLELLELGGMGKRRIQSLSGGQAQRVSLGRTLAPNPRLLLLDEPLAALDPTLRDVLSREIRQTIKGQKIPAIYVTHDLREVFFTADRLALMKDGHIHRTGQPHEIRNNPGDSYTADFFGLENQFEVELLGGNTLRCPWGEMELTGEDLAKLITPKQKILILPEDVRFVGSEFPNTPHSMPRHIFDAEILESRFLGTEYLLTLKLTRSSVRLSALSKTQLKSPQKILLNPATFLPLL